jgi:hypothetical protein
MMNFLTKEKIKMLKFLVLLILLANCSYKKPLKNSELIVPPFIQSENPEIYELFKSYKKQ